MQHNGQTSKRPSEWGRFLTFTISNPQVPIMIWFYGLLFKALTLLWLGYGVGRGILILIDHGPPEAFLMVMFQILAATIIYFLGDGLCHGERASIYGLMALCVTAILVVYYSLRCGYYVEMGVLGGAIFFFFVPPIFSGLRNFKMLV